MDEPEAVEDEQEVGEVEEVESEEEAAEIIEDEQILPKLTLTKQQKADITRAFVLLDQSGSGLIQADIVMIAIEALDYEVTSEELTKLIESVGESKSGMLSLNDFTTIIMRKIAEKDSEFDIVKSFLHFDVESNDFLTIENMRTVADELGDDLNDEEINEMFEAADENGDGIIEKEEFIKMINKCVTLVTP